MKNLFILFIFIFSVALSGCIVDVVEQNTERWAYANGKGLVSVYFDASIYRETFSVHGSALDTLIADGTFSLWAPSSSKAFSIAANVNMFWSIDTLHRGELTAYSQGSEKELLSINKMDATIPAKANLVVVTSTNDVSIEGMKGDINVSGNSSSVNFATAGRMTLQTSSGDITGTTGLGGSVQSTSGNINVTLPSKNFESVYATDSTGNVTLHIPSGVGVTFRLATYGGNITLAYDNVKQSSITAIQTTVNGGGKVVIVNTSKGNINVSN